MRLAGTRRGILILTLSVLGLAACSPMPYPTTVPKAVQRDLQGGAGPPPGVRAVALCYSRLVNTPEEVWSEARYLCPGSDVRYRGTDILWTSCSLQQPARATFLCIPRQRAEEAPPEAP